MPASSTTPTANPAPSKQPMASASADWPADCDQHFTVRAHAAASAADKTKIAVPAGQEFTATFTFRAPWGENPVQFLASRGRVDERSVVHHWTLFAVDDASLSDGAVEGGAGQATPLKSANQMYVVGGTVGSDPDLTMPEGIGLRFPFGKSVYFRLEMHYVNASDTPRMDGTELEFCVTSKPRPTEAAAHWLGTYLVNVPAKMKTDITTTCQPATMAGPVHLMAAAPHMHRLGASAKLVLNRKTGEKETLFDHPYDYNDQRSYKLPEGGGASDVVLNPGDTLTSTCSYQNDSPNNVAWGEHSNDEMCFTLVWAWPVGRMTNGSWLGGLVGALPDVTCLEP